MVSKTQKKTTTDVFAAPTTTTTTAVPNVPGRNFIFQKGR